MTENTFWQSLRRALVPRVYALKLNLRFTAGVPDCWLSGSDGDLWLELKYMQSVPKTVDPAKLLSALQQEWLKRRYAEGRRVGVLIGSPDGHLFFPALSWQATMSGGAFKTRAQKTKRVAQELIDYVGEIDPSMWAEVVE